MAISMSLTQPGAASEDAALQRTLDFLGLAENEEDEVPSVAVLAAALKRHEAADLEDAVHHLDVSYQMDHIRCHARLMVLIDR